MAIRLLFLVVLSSQPALADNNYGNSTDSGNAINPYGSSSNNNSSNYPSASNIPLFDEYRQVYGTGNEHGQKVGDGIGDYLCYSMRWNLFCD